MMLHLSRERERENAIVEGKEDDLKPNALSFFGRSPSSTLDVSQLKMLAHDVIFCWLVKRVRPIT